MTWRIDGPQGNESAKVRWDVIPYLRGRGLDIGCGPWKIFPHCVGVDQAVGGGADIILPATKLDIFHDELMDFVFSSHTLEDIVDTISTLKEWWRLLRVGGYLVLYLPHKDFYPNIGKEGANPAHKHDFAPNDIVEAMGVITAEGDRGWDLVKNQERNAGNEYSFLQVYRKRSDANCVHLWKNPLPEKTAGVVRYGAYGDAIWASSVISHLKEQGYHVTVYTENPGWEILRSDPNVDQIIRMEPYFMPPTEFVPFWLYESTKYDKWVNLVQVVEARLLPQPGDLTFYVPDEVRAVKFNKNYLEEYHDYAGIPHDFRQRFYPTSDEHSWARAFRAETPGPLVLINPTGSTVPKHWPHVQQLIDALDAEGIYSVVLGDLRDLKLTPPRKSKVIGMDWPIRQGLALAQVAEVVVGTESAFVNAVAFEDNLKVVLLSHSSHENLTKHWKNTVTTEPALPCFPCHRIHQNWFFCARDKKTGAAACQAVVSAEQIMNVIREYMKFLREYADESRAVETAAP